LEASEEISAEIMRLLQAQINALELDRVLSAQVAQDCEKRRKRIRNLNEQLHECKTRCACPERELEAMAREEQEQIMRGLQRTARIFKLSQSRQ